MHTRMTPTLSHSNLENRIHIFIFFRTDYCSSLLSDMNLKSLSPLQIVRIAAAQLLTRFKRWHHIIPAFSPLTPCVFYNLFWGFLITFKAHMVHQGSKQECWPRMSLSTSGGALQAASKSSLKFQDPSTLDEAPRRRKMYLSIHVIFYCLMSVVFFLLSPHHLYYCSFLQFDFIFPYLQSILLCNLCIFIQHWSL